MHALDLLTTAEMAQADRLAVAHGMSSLTLMESAGRAVADEAAHMLGNGGRIVVFCGPGNNGGDGFVAARLLEELGFDVSVTLFADRALLKGDAAVMAGLWRGKCDLPAAVHSKTPDLIIDALFGAGINRPMSAECSAALAAVQHSGIPILAVDVPSGIDGTTGAMVNVVARANRTVTFFRAKPGHYLMPGRVSCGKLIVADIGIPASVLNEIKPSTFLNNPALWRREFPRTSVEGHKYSRGHALVVSGPAHATGAARLAARGALRIGAGLVSVASPLESVAANAAHLTAIMIQPFAKADGLQGLLRDRRINACLIGPGAGVGAQTRTYVEQICVSHSALVLDADALTSFAGTATCTQLFDLIKARTAPVVMTPHRGEFERLFATMSNSASKLEKARTAAKLSGAIVVFKGADTVIAAPDGRAVINDNAPSTLGTAGSGDVLGGFITGLLAQGMPAFEASCAAVWLHGACAAEFGAGLIAEDLPEMLPRALANLAAEL